MQGGKDDHFVPQGYLRHFALEEDKRNLAREKWRVYVLRQAAFGLPARAEKISSVAYGKYFERHSGNEEWKSKIKQKINQLENDFFEVQNKLVEAENITHLTSQDRVQLTRYIAFQKERTLATRNLYKKRLEDASIIFKRSSKTKLDSSDFAEKAYERVDELISDKARLRDYHLETMFVLAEPLAVDLSVCHWTLYRNTTNRPSWTSDAPVVTFNEPNAERSEQTHGLLDNVEKLVSITEVASLRDEKGNISENYQLQFPISPKLSIVIRDCDDSVMGQRVSVADIRNEADVAKLNFRQTLFTSGGLYSNQPDFDRLTDMARLSEQVTEDAERDVRNLLKKLNAETT